MALVLLPDRFSVIKLTCTEVVDRRGFVTSGQTTFVVLASFGIVGLDVSQMVTAELVDGLFNFTKQIVD